MADRSRVRGPGNDDRISISSQEDHHPTKKSRDSSHQLSQDVTFPGGIKSLMDIDFDAGSPADRGSGQEVFSRRPEGQNGQRPVAPIASLLDVHLVRRPLPPPPPPPPPTLLPYMVALPGASHPAFPLNPPFPGPVAPLMPLSHSAMPLLPSPRPPPPAQPRPDDSGHIPSLLDLPMGGERRADQPPALLPGLAVREAEFEALMERLCHFARLRLPLCCVKPVKALEMALQRCQLPRGVRKYKQLDKRQSILCKVYVNNLLIGAGVGESTRDADIQAYSRALRLLREVAFEDILFGMPLREEIAEMLANLPQGQSPSPKPRRRLVVLEDRKPELGSNSFYILMLSAQFCARSVTLTTERDDNGQCSTLVHLDDEEVARASGEDEMEVRRVASNQALGKLKARCPVIEMANNSEAWKNQLRRSLPTRLQERVESMEKHITKARSFDEPIIVSTAQLSLKSPIASMKASELEHVFTHVVDVYVNSKVASPLIVAPLPARSQRLLLFRLARQRALCSEGVRLNAGHELVLVPVLRRRLSAEMLLPVLRASEGGRTQQFLLVHDVDDGETAAVTQQVKPLLS